MKAIYSVFLMLVIISCTNSAYPIKNDKIQANKDSTIINFLSNGTFKPYKGMITIRDTINTKKIIINVPYKYTSNDWVQILVGTAYYEMVKDSLFNLLLDNGQEIFYFSIIYNFQGPNHEALNACYFPSGFGLYNEHEKYYDFCKYIINNMTPSDFQAYDWAMEVLYEKHKDTRFKRTFYDFLLSVSKDNFLVEDEKYVFTRLIEWAKSRGDIEKPDHFIFFENSLIEDFDAEMNDE